MDLYKKPEFLLSVGTAAGLVISVGYFYKEILSVKDDIKLLTEHVNTNAKKIAGMQSYNKSVHQIGSVVRDMNTQQVRIAKEVTRSRQIAEQHDNYLSQLKDTLKKKDIDIPELSNQATNIPSGIRSRRNPVYNNNIQSTNFLTDDYDDYEDEDYDDDSDNLQALEQIRRKRRGNRVR